MITLHVDNLVGGNIVITTTPPIAPSPYFAYDSNRVITGLYQGSPNVWAEGTYYDYNDDEEKPYSGWTYSGSNLVENYATAIGNYAFDNTIAFEGVPPPKGITGNITFQNITNIGEGAFSCCNGLMSITMPNVTNIGNYAFYYCTNLTSVTIPTSVTRIGEGAFTGCNSLTSVTIPNSVMYIGNAVFSGCESLTSVIIGSGIQEIGSNAFQTYMENPITLTISKTNNEVEAMSYSNWGLPSGSIIVCTDDTIRV